MDPQRLKDNFSQVATHGIDVAEYFYADLFERNPSYRSLFPASMARQQQVLLGALAQIVSLVDDPQQLIPYVEELGRSHAGSGVDAQHYPEVGASLVATLKYFSGDDWNAELEKNWVEAYGVVADVMIKAADQK
ncbi:globin domain-containing protein [Actinoallomurus purpureus]|uniref:globin domain-containing protein n=1 Tax=Actinoallomurus purpureus TaxID=478114 RepID=UPI00209400BE|nr:globin domain-containing protein [Actinoallomurus purpureus]MCO6011269.1 globin domain-containing protein [Actinoallomurus purpureus]